MVDEGTTVTAEFYAKQTIEIEIPDGVLKGTYSTKIANLNNNALLMEVPQVGNLYLPLQVSQPVILRYVIESWAYEIPLAVVTRRDNLDMPLFLVNRPKNVKRRLLRKFVRVDCDIDASVFLIGDLKEYGREKFSDDELTQGTIRDISGGGARIRVPFDMPTDFKRYALLWFTLPLVHKSYFNMLTRVKLVRQNPPTDKFIITEFTGLSETERDDIVQFCFRWQTQSRMKPGPTPGAAPGTAPGGEPGPAAGGAS